LKFDSTLDNISNADGSPLRGRDSSLVKKLQQEMKPGKGNQKDYSLQKWRGPSLVDLAHRNASPNR
jgi:hypothetical protein